jgi:hypothetical protein
MAELMKQYIEAVTNCNSEEATRIMAEIKKQSK